MKEIFTDLYNKVVNFFQSSKEDSENTKETACNRLKLVLMQDRVHMDPFIMQKMREEMIAILNKYLEIDNDALDLNLAGEGDSIALMFNIPVIRAKSNEEIEEYEAEMKERLTQELQENQKTDEINDDKNSEEQNDVDVENVVEKNEQNSENEEETSEENFEQNEEEVIEEEPAKKEKKSSKKSED